MSGVIYIITTGDEGYVGSTNNFKQRLVDHKSSIYNKNSHVYNFKLYKKIRENNGQYEINIYEDNLSLTKTELRIREEEVRVLLGATLNSQRAYRTEEQKKNQINKWRSVPIKCDCGLMIHNNSAARHKRTAKHIKRMISLEQNDQA